MFVSTHRLLQELVRKSILSTGDEEVGILDGSLLALIAADIAPSADTLLADLVEANYNTYVRQVTTAWGAAYKSGQGFWLSQGAGKIFTPTDALQPNTIFGYALVEVGGTLLLGCEMFDSPIVLASAIDSLTVVPRIGPFITAPFGMSLIG